SVSCRDRYPNGPFGERTLHKKVNSPLLAGIRNLIRNRDPMGGLNPKACNRPLDDIIINRFK
ncbi:MAG: hypothetical protein V3V48_02360, partial [Candidatus Aminicenantaceae bacterium]